MAASSRLPAMASAASHASRTLDPTTNVAAPLPTSAETGQPPRKRGRHIHERQVLADFFSDEQDLADGQAPPTNLIKDMSTHDLYEDVYSTYKVDTSFSNLPEAKKRAMLEGISAVASKVAGRVVQASAADPTAITVPRSHIHDTVLVPQAAIANAADDRLASVKEAHMAQVCELHAYDVLEDFARSLEFGGVSRRMSLAKLVRTDLRACMPHSMHHTDDLSYLILEIDERQVFFAAVGVRWCAATGAEIEDAQGSAEPTTAPLAKARATPYMPWSTAVLGDLGAAIVEVVSHCYFTCPCV